MNAFGGERLQGGNMLNMIIVLNMRQVLIYLALQPRQVM